MIRYTAMLFTMLILAGCNQQSANAPEAASTPEAADNETPMPTDEPKAGLTAGQFEFPSIPTIVVPQIIGIGEAQKAMETSLDELLKAVDGITIQPARCTPDNALVTDAGITEVTGDGTVNQISKLGVFEMKPDGSGHAVIEGGVFEVNADGTGSIVRDTEVITYEGQGQGNYVRDGLVIELDGKGGGTQTGEYGVIQNAGDGSGNYSGDIGVVEINADGSGSWSGPKGVITNNGDGTGTIGTKTVAMAPIPPVAPAPKFPSIDRFVPKQPTCGILITLDDRVLFDFDKSTLRVEASVVLDDLSKALQDAALKNSSLEIRGHTDSKGSDDYNQTLSEARANAVMNALKAGKLSQTMSAEGFGESKPVASNERKNTKGELIDDPAGRQRNRRVEIFVRN
jgi:OmpA-OmpF porin, OOP family